MRNFAGLVIMALLMVGCVAEPCPSNIKPILPRPTKEQIEAQDIGPAPDMARVRQAVNDWCQRHLRDPGSAQIEPLPPSKGCYYSLTYSDPPTFAWESITYINGKNANGGYTGRQAYSFYFKDGALAHVDTPVAH